MALKAFCRLYLNNVIVKVVYSYLKMWKSAGKGFRVSSAKPAVTDFAFIWLTCYNVTVYQYSFVGFPRLQSQQKRPSLTSMFILF